MAGKLAFAVVVTILAALQYQTAVAQEVHVVGDSIGWIVPPGGPIAYSTWASLQTFSVGDILIFNFTTGQQDVARVTKEAFDTCNSTNPIFLSTNGPVNYTLSSGGSYYFIGTMDRHCFLGQKLAINVTGVSSPTASPAPPPPPPSAPVPMPPRAPVTYEVGDSLGWVVPPGGPIAYSTWAYEKTFFVGDTLVFNFQNGTQDVAIVTKAAYDSCDTANATTVLTTSPARITLTAAGEYFFTSTYPRHCSLGQKLAINVMAASGGPTASPAPIPPPSTPVPAPPRSPVTYVVGDGLGWVVPPGGPIAYSTWAYDKTFFVGDTLVFNFKNGTQDVALVTKAAYDSCDTANATTVLTTSPARITLTAAGEYFFTSTYPRHCSLGQKLTINVMAASGGPTASPAPIPPPSTPVPAPPRSPVTYVVGDELGWVVPPGGPIAYSTWAYRKTFFVGDSLVFNFKNGTADVAQVSKAAYDSCNTTTTTSVLTTSPAKVTLTAAGEYFFTSTYSRHCSLGQKLAINVTATSSTATPPSTSPSGSIAEPPADSPTEAGGPIPPPSSSASSNAVISFFSATFLSIVTAFLL